MALIYNKGTELINSLTTDEQDNKDNSAVSDVVVTSEMLDKAKDLLWKHLEKHSKEILLYMTANNQFENNDLLVFRTPVEIGFTRVNNSSNPLCDNN